MNNGLALLKNCREYGSDGLLLRGLLSTSKTWSIHALDRKNEYIDEIFERDGVVINTYAGPKRNYSMLARISPIFKIGKKLVQNGFLKNVPPLVIAGSVELAFLAQWIVGSANVKIYLFSDLTDFHMKKASGLLIRYIECKWLQGRSWKVAITSPGFYSNYLERQKFDIGNVYFVHNLPLSRFSICASSFDEFKKDFSIGWFGLLRCDLSSRLIFELNKRIGLRVSIGGIYSWLPGGAGTVFCCNDLLDYGEYREDDLGDMYGGTNLSWCCDWSLGSNSISLLPNRLYQSISALRPLIVSKGSFLEKVVRFYNIGFSISSEVEDAVNVMLSVRNEDYVVWVENLEKLKVRLLSYGNQWELIIAGNGNLLKDIHCDGGIFE